MSPTSGTVTFLFTDIEGSTALLGRLGAEDYAKVLAEHHRLVREALSAHGGTEVDTQGDAFFAVFSSPRGCAAAAVSIQRSLAASSWPGGERVLVRMGLHHGEATETPTGPVGMEVHRAARVSAVAHGGQIVLSETAATLVRGFLPEGEVLQDLGVHRLKDLGRPEHLFQLSAEGLPAGFPPLRSLDNPALRHNLPEQLAAFVGRSYELAHVRDLVGSARLVTLTGAGGSGKTRLALQAAAELLDGSGDGVWLVELAPLSDEDLVAPAIAETLGVPQQPGRPSLETLVDALQTQEVLIVLDNCEHVVGTCAKVADALVRRCPRLHIMATSREPLGIAGETIYRVPSMSVPSEGQTDISASDAVALFVDRARAQGVELRIDAETVPLLASICRRLDGMPLALELAAARLRSLSLAGVHERLGQRFRLLTGGSRSALARQQTLRATVDWSYSLLNSVEQALLCRLSVFAESFSLEAAEAVCGFGSIEVFDVADLLGSLVDKSLVQTEMAGPAMRYRLLETIRQFAAERLVEHDAEAGAVGDAHQAFFLSFAEEAHDHLGGPGQIDWANRLDLDHANFRRAFEHAKGSDNGAEHLLRFGWALMRYWLMRDQTSEGVGVLRAAVDDPGAAAHPQLLGRGLVSAAYMGVGADVSGSITWSERALDIAAGLGDEQLMIEALGTRAGTAYFAGEFSQGLKFGQEALDRARAFGAEVLLASTLILHLLCSDRLQPEKSDALYAEAIASTERSGDLLTRLMLLNNAGVSALRRGELAGARRSIEECIALGAKMGHRSHHTLVNLGWVLREEHDPEAARAQFEAGVRLSRLQGEIDGIAYSALGLACLAADSDDWQRAARLLGVADGLLGATGAPWQHPESAYRAASVERIVGHIDAAAFEAEHSKGRGFSVEAAIRYCQDGG